MALSGREAFDHGADLAGSAWVLAWGLVMAIQAGILAQGTRDTTTYRRIRAELDAIPAIDTHDHLWPFERLPGLVETDRGKGMNLSSLWRNSYYPWINPLTPWTPGMTFDAWWSKAKHDFDSRAGHELLSLPAPRLPRPLRRRLRPDHRRAGRGAQRPDLRQLPRPDAGSYHVVTERANIELMFNDPYWARLEFHTDYPFGVLVFNVTTLVSRVPPLRVQAARRRPLPLRQASRA